MANVELQPGEQLLEQGPVPYLKRRFNLVQGGAYLTNRRFLHTNDMRSPATGGFVGTVIKGKIDIEIALASIARISRGKHGRNEAVLEVETAEGHEYRLLPPFDEWLQAFGDALAVHHGTKLVQLSPGQWDRATRLTTSFGRSTCAPGQRVCVVDWWRAMWSMQPRRVATCG